MGKHVLQLNFPETANEGIFLIDDISIYDMLSSSAISTNSSASAQQVTPSHNPCNGLQLPCSTLEITPPGYSTPTGLTVNPMFRLVLNACLLGILPVTGCVGCCPAIPDGMYNIRYSVSPNDKIYVEYKIMRIVRALNRYYGLLCKLGMKPCLPDADTQYQIQQLDLIYNFLLSSKVTVENEHNFTDGMNQYRYAVQLMDKMDYEPKRC